MEVPIHARLRSARRSSNHAIRHALALAATTLLSIVVTSAPVWAAAPSNDELAGAASMALGDQVAADTTEATTNDGDAALNAGCGLPSTNASVWYTFTPTADRGFAVDTTASSYGAGFIVFEGTPSTSTEIACGFGQEGGLAAHAGKTYTIMVVDLDGDQTNGGSLVLDLQDSGPLPTMKVSVDSRAAVDKTGVVWLTGTYSCSLASRVGFDIQLSQTVGRFTVNGYGSMTDDTPCDGSTIPFRLAVSGYDGKFAGGKATALLSTDACGDGACDNTYSQQTLQLVKGR